MPRNLTAQFITALNEAELRPVILLDLEFESSTVLLWNGVGELLWDGKTYLGNGWFQGHSPIKENGEVNPQGVSVVLTGIPPSLLSLVLQQTSQNKVATLRLGLLDTSYQVIPDPTIIYQGKIDYPEIIEDSEEPTIKIAIENILLDMDRPRNHRYTKQSQRDIFPDDEGFDTVEPIQKFDGKWGGRKNRKKNRRKKNRKNREG